MHSLNFELLFKPLCGSINNLENLKIDTIEPLYVPIGNDMILFKIVTSSMKSEPRIVIFNDKNEMIINIVLSESNLSVTAYCVTSAYFDTQKSLSVNLLLATSDSVLRLIKCSTNDYNQSGEGKWEQIRIYPTGEQVTKLLAINWNPLTIMCGHQCGEINFYTIL
ncbi:unnamed protein product [Trichobilharzia szidati]|nr:unnamed protein product [Trichobilharzia szidati]